MVNPASKPWGGCIQTNRQPRPQGKTWEGPERLWSGGSLGGLGRSDEGFMDRRQPSDEVGGFSARLAHSPDISLLRKTLVPLT